MYKTEDLSFQLSNYSFSNFIYDSNIHKDHLANIIIKDNQMFKLVPANFGYYSPKERLEMTTKINGYNARSEDIEGSFIWSQPFQTKRCLIPVSGFYSYVNAPRRTKPYMYKIKNKSVFYLAGLYQYNDNLNIHSFAIITGSGEQSKQSPNRYPIIIDGVDTFDWLAHADNDNFFRNAAIDNVTKKEVSRRISQPKYKDLKMLYHVG